MPKMIILTILIVSLLLAPTVSVDSQCDAININTDIITITSGEHFDEILGETPDSFRPPSLILFTTESMDSFAPITEYLPGREQLLLGYYNTDQNEKRHWFEFSPEMNLTKRFGITRLPTLVWVPRKCKGNTTWCVRDEVDNTLVIGCDDYITDCTESDVDKWDLTSDEEQFDFIWRHIRAEDPVILDPRFKTWDQQKTWLRNRDRTTTDNQLRDFYFPLEIRNYTKLGFEARPTPHGFQQWMMNFYMQQRNDPVIETWNTDATQLNFHDVQTKMYNLDKVYREKEYWANNVIKPILEEWAGIKLKLTSFYGIREYPEGSILKNHIDRIDTHVISVTFSVAKFNNTGREPWYIEAIANDGKRYRYDHPPATMLLYESARVPHGRPYRNKDGTHLGAFMHFKPDGPSESEYTEMVRKARLLKSKFTT